MDFLSIDIEGAELAVLNTIPWDKVDIELVMLEVNVFIVISLQLETMCSGRAFRQGGISRNNDTGRLLRMEKSSEPRYHF